MSKQEAWLEEAEECAGSDPGAANFGVGCMSCRPLPTICHTHVYRPCKPSLVKPVVQESLDQHRTGNAGNAGNARHSSGGVVWGSCVQVNGQGSYQKDPSQVRPAHCPSRALAPL